MRLKWWSSLVLAVAATACAWQRPAPVCRLDVELDLFPPWQPKPADVDLSLLSSLLLRGVDMDCTGRPLLPSAASWRPLQPAQVHLEEHAQDVWLVWLKTHDAGDGTLVGPVARVEVAYRKLEVTAIGALRALPRDVRLLLRGGVGGDVLEVHSGNCTAQAAEGACTSEVQLLPAQHGRFVASAGATLPLRRRQVAPCGRGCRRIFAFEAELERASDRPWAYELHERLSVEEHTGQRDASTSRPLRQSEGKRSFVFDGNAWQSSGPPLGERIQAW